MASQAAARHFERVAPDYTDLRRRGTKGLLRRSEQRAVFELARLEPGARVLDAGCGDGEILDWITSRGARPIGIDLVPGMAWRCRARGFDVCVQDMEAIGFRACFDWVLCIGSLEFTLDPQRALRGFADCLRPGGKLVLLYPRTGWLGAVYSAYHRSHGVPIWLFSQEQISALLARAGLEAREWRHCLLSSVCLAEKAKGTG